MKLIFPWILLLFVVVQACKSGQKAASPVAADRHTAAIPDEKQVNLQYNYYNAVKEKLLGNYDKALELFSQVLRIDQNNHAAMYEMAGLYLERNKVNDALHFAKNAASLNPKNEWYQLLLADIYTKTGRTQDAVGVYEQLVNTHPDRIDFLFQWAVCNNI